MSNLARPAPSLIRAATGMRCGTLVPLRPGVVSLLLYNIPTNYAMKSTDHTGRSLIGLPIYIFS